MSNYKEGFCTYWDFNRGFGFITFDDEDRKIYVHHSSLIGCRRLKKYQYVKFTIGENKHGEIAENVEVLYAKTKTNTGTVSHKAV